MTAVLITGSVDENAANRIHSGRLIQISSSVWYVIARDANSIAVFKSTDGCATWTLKTAASGVFSSGGFIACGYFFEPWGSSSASDVIHFFGFDDTGSQGLYHVTYNCDTDTVGTVHQVVSTGSSGGAIFHATGTVSESGRIWISAHGSFSTGPLGTWWSENGGTSWTAYGTDIAEVIEDDMWLMWPDPAASDTDDACAFFWDFSANQISKKDVDATGTITETTIASSMTEDGAKGNWSVSLSPTTEHFRLVALSAGATPTVRAFDITGTTVVEKTAVISSTTGVENVALSIFEDTDATVCFYEREGEVYYKISLDQMATWQAETRYNSVDNENVFSLAADPVPRNSAELATAWLNSSDELWIEVPTIPLQSSFPQYRLMLAEASAPDTPTLNITSQNVAVS